MDKINLLECTLRDGGYITGWHFPEEMIREVAEMGYKLFVQPMVTKEMYTKCRKPYVLEMYDKFISEGRA